MKEIIAGLRHRMKQAPRVLTYIMVPRDWCERIVAKLDTPPAKITRIPDKITVARLECVVMNGNGEIICAGKTIGWVSTHAQYLTRVEE